MAAPIPAAASAHPTAAASLADLGELSIDQLVDLEITSVSRRAEPVATAPAAVYVITSDEIRRSGVLTLPESLRLAPNLQVARSDASTWAITARGFNHNTATANKLQVLVDGRSVYNSLFSGVLWDVQNVMLADVDRIEVISGPAGVAWGSNAVNGVINVVSRNARDTQGLLVDAAAGPVDRAVNLRYGARLGEDLAVRVYGMGLRRGPSWSPGAPNHRALDGWTIWKAGLRADWESGPDAVSILADLYDGGGQDIPGSVADTELGGSDVVGRWTRRTADGGAIEAKAYHQRNTRTLSSGISAAVDVWDFEAQRQMAVGRHRLVIGGGYRVSHDEFTPGPGTILLDPDERSLRLGSLFVQDDVALSDRLKLTLGLRFEHNSYTGAEWMPNLRLAWTPAEGTLLWGAVARAVRTPSRFDRDLVNTNVILGGDDFISEVLTAYELGYRGRPLPRVSVSISGFYNVYDELRTLEASGPAVVPLVIRNGMQGSTYGVEAWGQWSVTDWWRLFAGASWLHKNLKLEPASLDVAGVLFAGNDPSHQYQVRSSMNLPGRLELDAGLRAVDDLPSPAIPSYVELNARLAWRATDQVELSLVGQHLLNAHHLEFRNPAVPTREVRRSLLAAVRWVF